MPSRCRNNLADFENFSLLLQKAQSKAYKNSDELYNAIEKDLGFPSDALSTNRFSDVGYRALQFTTRYLIRIPLIRKGVKSEVAFFFPVEIQVLDKTSLNAIESGHAAHEAYKKKQLEAVRARVLIGTDS
jgi:uncharacterized protein (TIGR04562 family)